MNKSEQIERAIEVLGLQVKALNDELKTLEFEEDIEAYKFDISIKSLAIESLQQSLEREKNEPLTIEQLEGMAGEPIWDNFYKEWGVLETVDYNDMDGVEVEFTYGKNVWYQDTRFYKYKKGE